MMRNFPRVIAAMTMAAAAFTTGQTASAQNALPDPLVYLRDVDPTIAQDIRYATLNNFTGKPLPGYDAAECVLTRQAAFALKQVQADLAASNLALKVYDCYRPERAVRAMAAWSQDGRDQKPTKRFFPNIDKRNLFALGYIARYSRHSTGTAIDLTLIWKNAAPAAAFDPAASYGACTAPLAARAPDNSIDMGTGYDCLDPQGHTAAGNITLEQHQNRTMLVAALRKRGLSNYFREWWHFTFGGNASTHYNTPILPRPGR
jgi:D-alanyl-D-alanine dipeptidase